MQKEATHSKPEPKTLHIPPQTKKVPENGFSSDFPSRCHVRSERVSRIVFFDPCRAPLARCRPCNIAATFRPSLIGPARKGLA